METLSKVREKFDEIFGGQPLIVRSPGRINLIGEHTDYNDGFVMPAAINFDTIFAISLASDGRSEIYSEKYDSLYEVQIDDVNPVTDPKWANFLLGVVKQFLLKGLEVKPFKCVFGGDVPLGAGLSSSASIECGFAFAMNQLMGYNLSRQEMALMAQWSEHNFVGVKCGIMDQFASIMGKKDHVILLDCRSLNFEYYPISLPDHDVLLCDTKVKHSLVDSEYNTRRAECEAGVKILRKHYPDVHSLRDATEEMIREHQSEMTGKMFQRCLYVVQEIARVQKASEDLKANRLVDFGKKMYETHEGLSRMYEVSCPELDFLVSEAKKNPAILGSRMMGGGFGGCTISIVPKSNVKEFVDQVSVSYQKKFGHDMDYYIVSIEDGTHAVTNDIHINEKL